MTNEEYIKSHPEQFKDDIDKWLFIELGIMGGCCSAEKSHEYAIARMVAEKQQEWFEKNRLAHCDEITKEQAQIESDFVVNHLKKNKRTPTFIDAIEYGMDKMIDRACEWLKNWAYFSVNDTTDSFDEDDLVRRFRKAMKGGRQ